VEQPARISHFFNNTRTYHNTSRAVMKPRAALIWPINELPRSRAARYQVCHSGLSGIVPAMFSYKKDSRQAGITESTIIIRTPKQSFEEFFGLRDNPDTTKHSQFPHELLTFVYNFLITFFWLYCEMFHVEHFTYLLKN
jgi:hypothetical protein